VTVRHLVDRDAPTAAARFLRFLETGTAPEGLFAPDVFGDLTFPHWRVQATSADELLAIRRREHPGPSDVRVERLDPTDRGWVLQLEERWDADGQRWYAREMFRADIEDGRITELTAYCTGDWDEAAQRRHREAVTLVRP